MINLGSRVKDSISGFEGVAFERQDFMYGCARIAIEPTELDKDGSVRDSQIFDEQRVDVLEAAKPFIYPPKAVKMGSKVRDRISGFSGIATAIAVNMYGTQHVAIEPDKCHEGKPVKASWFHSTRIELVEEKVPPVSKSSSARSGGPETSGWGRR